jgi:hypothetical protein
MIQAAGAAATWPASAAIASALASAPASAAGTSSAATGVSAAGACAAGSQPSSRAPGGSAAPAAAGCCLEPSGSGAALLAGLGSVLLLGHTSVPCGSSSSSSSPTAAAHGMAGRPLLAEGPLPEPGLSAGSCGHRSWPAVVPALSGTQAAPSSRTSTCSTLRRRNIQLACHVVRRFAVG